MSIITNDLPEVKRLEDELLRVRADNELQQKNITFKAKQLVELRAERDRFGNQVNELNRELDALRAQLRAAVQDGNTHSPWPNKHHAGETDPFPITNPCAVCGVKDGHAKGCPEDTAVPDAGGALTDAALKFESATMAHAAHSSTCDYCNSLDVDCATAGELWLKGTKARTDLFSVLHAAQRAAPSPAPAENGE